MTSAAHLTQEAVFCSGSLVLAIAKHALQSVWPEKPRTKSALRYHVEITANTALKYKDCIRAAQDRERRSSTADFCLGQIFPTTCKYTLEIFILKDVVKTNTLDY